jgi:hypothetical protein
MNDDVKIELAVQALFALISLIKQYKDDGYEVSEDLAEAMEQLKELDDELAAKLPYSYGE